MNIQYGYAFFIIRVLIAEFLFTYSFKKRKLFWLRLIGVVVVGVLCGLNYPRSPIPDNQMFNAFYKFLRFFLLYVYTIFGQWFLFNERFRTILTACTAGYAAEHISQRISAIILMYFSPFSGLDQPYKSFLDMVCFIFPFYIVLFFLFAENTRKQKPEDDYRFDIISITLVFTTMIVSRISEFGVRSNEAKIAEYIYSISCCIAMLYFQRLFFVSNAKEKELHATEQLYEKSKEEFRNWQNSIDVINTKCHDLKQHLSSMNQNLSEETVKEIGDSIMFYESAIKTGNEVLDIILFEKNVQCEREGIEFVFMVDGNAVSFMKKEDIFSLFGNLIANAIEASEQIEEKGKRVIHLSVFQMEDSVVIHEENYYCGQPVEIDSGLPVTTKEDKTIHGYGVRSMKMIVEKYSGSISFKSQEEIFSLNILMPIAREN